MIQPHPLASSPARDLAPSSGKGVVPSSDRGVVPSSGEAVVPSSDRGVVLSSGKAVVPSSDGDVVPSSGKGVVPPSDRRVAPSLKNRNCLSVGSGANCPDSVFADGFETSLIGVELDEDGGGGIVSCAVGRGGDNGSVGAGRPHNSIG